MTDDGTITNQMLLEHMQAGKYELMEHMSQKFKKIDERFKSMDQRFARLEKRVEEGFEEARKDREALHEDLDAIIRMQFKQQKQLAAIGAAPMPEEY